MDMDIDVSWCLTCSKRVPNPASPYCSYECRQLDGHGQSSSPSRLLPVYNNALSRTTTVREGSIRRKPSAPTASRPACVLAQQRDRRAYSFPAAFAASPSLLDDESPPKTPAPTTSAAALLTPSSFQQLRFARRTQAVPVTYTGPVVDDTTLTGKTPRHSRPPLLSAPLRYSSVPSVLPTESAICSTSEESDEEPAPELSVPSPTRITRPSLATQPTDKTNSTAATYASYLPPVLPLPTRKPSVSRSPSAFLAATSASRSREDILSWAKAVGMRPRPSKHSAHGELDEVRGRGRDRRRDMEQDLPPIPPPGSPTPSSSSIEGDTEAEAGVGTTPKGVAALGSALFGLGFAPFINRKTPVAVAAVNVEESHNMAIHPGGTTPTISTVSFSEVMEPSIGTDVDNIDICNDESFTDCSRSGFHRSVPVPSYFQSSPKQPKQPSISPTTSTPTQQTSPSPLKPIASTANALWNLSAYLRSFKPFSLAAALTPGAGSVDKAHDQSTFLPPTPVSGLASVPMPARSPIAEDEVEDPKEMVKSLPMDIIPMGLRTAQQGGEPKLDRRSRSRSRSRSPSSQALLGRGGKGLGVGRQRDNYSVKSSRASSLSDEDPAAGDRGRCRRVSADPIEPVVSKIAPVLLTPVGCLADLPPPVQEEVEQEGRGRNRRRDLDSVSRGRSGSRGRKARGRAR